MYAKEKVASVEAQRDQNREKQQGLAGTQRDLREIQIKIEVESTRLSKQKVEIERDAEEMAHAYKLRMASRQEMIEGTESIKAKEIEIFEREA